VFVSTVLLDPDPSCICQAFYFCVKGVKRFSLILNLTYSFRRSLFHKPGSWQESENENGWNTKVPSSSDLWSFDSPSMASDPNRILGSTPSGGGDLFSQSLTGRRGLQPTLSSGSTPSITRHSSRELTQSSTRRGSAEKAPSFTRLGSTEKAPNKPAPEAFDVPQTVAEVQVMQSRSRH